MSIILALMIFVGALVIGGGPEKLAGHFVGSLAGRKAADVLPAPKAAVRIKHDGNFCRVGEGFGGPILLTDAEIKLLSVQSLARIEKENEYGAKHCPNWKGSAP